MKYRVVISDLDGTLLDAAHAITPFTRSTLLALLEHGVHLIFATGRHHLDVKAIQKTIGIVTFIVTSNGARVHCPKGTLFSRCDLDPSLVNPLLHLAAQDSSILTNVYQDDRWLINGALPTAVLSFHPYSQFQAERMVIPVSSTEHVSKIFYIGPVKQLNQLKRVIEARFEDQINVSFSQKECLEVMASGVSKASALEGAVRSLGFQLKDCIAFGDAMNDLEMLEAVGKGCVMQNAQASLKTALPHLEVIGSNQEDAVAAYLHQHLLQHLLQGV